MSKCVYKPSGKVKGIDDSSLKPTYTVQVTDNQKKNKEKEK